jgi:hypothetical protein
MPFADAMARSMLLPVLAAVLGVMTTVFLTRREQPSIKAVTPSLGPTGEVSVSR